MPRPLPSHAGDRCGSISVALVGTAADELLSRPIEISKVVKPGDPASRVRLGSVRNRAAFERTSRNIAEAARTSARLLVDESRLEVSGFKEGLWLGPTIFYRVAPDMRLYKEEIPSPVLACVRVPNVEDAIALVNTSEFGNSVSCFTRKTAAAQEFAQEIEGGSVGFNECGPVVRRSRILWLAPDLIRWCERLRTRRPEFRYPPENRETGFRGGNVRRLQTGRQLGDRRLCSVKAGRQQIYAPSNAYERISIGRLPRLSERHWARRQYGSNNGDPILE